MTFSEKASVAAYSEVLCDLFVTRVLPDNAMQREGLTPFFEHVIASPHSVVTAHLIDVAGQPTFATFDEILAFFAMRLEQSPS